MEGGGLSREDLVAALAPLKVPDLQEMGRRLQRTHSAFSEELQDLEAEREELQQENASLRETIELMMTELRKLNIGADNMVEPQLEEGPLNFVARAWEKVRPRDTGVVISEHVGEIRKPSGQQDGSPSSAQAAQQLGQAVEKGKEVVQKLSTAIGPLWARAEGLLSASQVEPRKLRKKRTARTGEKRRDSADGSSPVAATNGQAEADSAAAAVPADAAPAGLPAVAPTASAAAAAAPAASSTVALPATGEVPTAPTPESAPDEAPATEPRAPGAEASPAPASGPAPDAAPATEPRAPGAEEQISSTILIEAQLKLEDGNVQSLQVLAADRCKEVAHRFVQEHSLKAWYVDPLTSWLKKVEADALKFPVKVEGDLIEIRKQHSKR